jgi:hypothetical protein
MIRYSITSFTVADECRTVPSVASDEELEYSNVPMPGTHAVFLESVDTDMFQPENGSVQLIFCQIQTMKMGAMETRHRTRVRVSGFKSCHY